MKRGGIMNQLGRIQTVCLYGVFLCYILLLIKILFFSRVWDLALFDRQRALFGAANLVPFHSIMAYISGRSADIFGNVVGNIALFVPLGVYLPLLKQDKRVRANLSVILLVSLLVELIQGLFGMGAADVDDVILNCLGGWIGMLGYQLCLFILRDEKKVRAVIWVLSVIGGLPVILYLLFMVRMRF